MVSRADRSIVAEWWRTIDRPLLGAIIFLMLCGLFMSFSASPPVAERIGVDGFHFIKRHAIFLVPSIIALLIVSMLTPTQVRRSAFLLFAISVLLMLATLFVGSEVKGSRRWLYIAGFTLQPSEFVKPAM